jgi:hypothetical protein
MPLIIIDERRVRHIFRDAEGHFAQDTAVNRQTLIDVANRPENFRGRDRFGNEWFMETRPDGRQVWVHVRGDKITDGGLNRNPRGFELSGGPP